LSDFGSLRLNAKIQNGNDIVTVSDASGTLGSASNASIANLGSGWTGVEYIPAGDCCNTEAFFFTSSTPTTVKVRVAVVNGTTNAPNCAATFTGTTAESNNLNLGDCTPVGGATPAIVFSESGSWNAAPLPVSINNTLSFIKTANTPNGKVEVHLASGTSGYLIRTFEPPATTFENESDGVWQLLPNQDLAFIKTSNTKNGQVEVYSASRASNYTTRIGIPTTVVNEADGVWQLLPNQDLAFIKTSNTKNGQVEVDIASSSSNYTTTIFPTTFANESDGVWALLVPCGIGPFKTC
jgi:hypothetical protein